MKALIRIIVGFLVSTSIMCLIAGGVEDAFMILLISIVCTAGIGLVVWIPAWWAVGWLALSLFTAIRGPTDDPGRAEHSAESASQGFSPEELTSNESSLLQYLKGARARGIEDTRIDKALLAGGWSESEIQHARQALGSSAAGM